MNSYEFPKDGADSPQEDGDIQAIFKNGGISISNHQ